MSHLTSNAVSVALAIIGVAIIAVIVSKSAQTGNILGQIGNSFSQTIGCALNPITGSGCGTQVTSTISF